MDGETAVSNDYKQGDNKFTGTIEKIVIDIDPSRLSKEVQARIKAIDNEAAIMED